MPNVRLTWVNNSTGHDGQIVRMGEPGGAKSDIADLGPNVEEYIALNATEPEACFIVAAYEGGAEEESGVTCVETGESPPDLPEVGDYYQGGVYAGIMTYGDSRQFHIILSLLEDVSGDLYWRTVTDETGAQNLDDGVANSDIVTPLSGSELFDYCDTYSRDGFEDWYFPARNEMQFIHQQLGGTAEVPLSYTTLYSTSTELAADPTKFIFWRFDTELQELTQAKNSVNRWPCRPIRRIAV